MATKQEAKQALIDRVNSLTNTITTIEEANFLSKALKQIGTNPRYFDTSREIPRGNLRNEEQASDTTSVSSIHNGIHRERETTHTSFMANNREPGVQNSTVERVNFQNDATLGNRPEFGIWANHSDAHGCGTSFDAYLRPHDRKMYYSSGSHWQGGSEATPATGTYSSHQKHQFGTFNNNCYMQCQTAASHDNTNQIYEIPSRTSNVGEVGHYRIKMHAAGLGHCRMHESGNQMRRENLDCGTAMLDHKHSYMKLNGKILSLREKWMPPEYQSWTSNQGWQARETTDSPSSLDIHYGYDGTNAQAQAFERAHGTVSYNKTRQEVVHFSQVASGVPGMIGKCYRHVDRIRRLTILDHVLRDENAVYFKFNYGTGFNPGATDQIEPQKCAKITLTDDGSIFSTMYNTGSSTYALGKVNSSWLTKTNGFIQDLVITDVGTGYQSPPTITIASPNGTGTQATGTLTIDSSTGRVNGITITNVGSGYSLAKEDGYGHPTVTVDDTGTSGSGCKIVSCVCVTADWDNISTLPTHGTIYGRGTTLVGQQIMMSKDRSKSLHFAPYYGFGCGIVSFIIDRDTNSWAPGYYNTDTDYGCQPVPFREKQFIFGVNRNWGDGAENNQAWLYYEEAQPTIDANDNNKNTGWKSDNVGRHLESGVGATNHPAFIPFA